MAHLGDLGCGLTPEQAEALSGLDALLIPVGGFYTIDAGQAKAVVDQLKPRVVVPMHYRGKGLRLRGHRFGGGFPRPPERRGAL